MAAPGMKASKKELHKYEIAYEKRRREKINAASYIGDIPKDVLADFPPAFCRFARNGLDIDLVFTSPEHPSWTKDIEDAIFQLTKTNMQALYDAAPGWSWADGKKRSETRHSDTRYILARNREDAAIVAFAAFRFIMEDDYDVVYLYELQLGPGVQRKGLGKLLMQLVELTAKKNGMQWVMLTVLKNNVAAVDFYTKLKYEVDETSPSISGEDAGHEILSKIVDKVGVAAVEARVTALENGRLPDDAATILTPLVVAATTTAAGAGESAADK